MASRKFNLILSLLLSVSVFAQKNLVPVSSSAYTGIVLPAGARQDKRLFNVAVVMTFLEGETKKFNVTVSDAEIFRLPPGTNHTENLKASLNTKGWEIRRLDERPEYAWLIKQGQYFFMYWSANPKNPELYIGKPEGIPVFESSTPIVNNQSVVQQQQPVTQSSLPPVQQKQAQQTQLSTEQPAAKSLQPVRTDEYTYSVTNWDDGWVSTIENDKVVVTKGAIRVHLYYPVAHNDVSRNAGRDFYWDNYLTKEFRLLTKQYRDHGEMISSFQAPYIEGTAIDPKTNKQCFLAMYVTSSNGNMFPVVAVASDEPTLRKTFPNAENQYDSELPAMSRYNRFAVALADLVGTWEESSGAAANMYNVVTGAYAGMATASSAHSFTFNADGTYNSKHSGAHGMVGSMTFFDQKYEGKLTVTQWDITMTNRWQGKTEYWWAQFEVVRGGRVLHITDKAASAMHYALVKTK